MAVLMENNMLVKATEANTRVIDAKTVVTVDYLTAKSKPWSLITVELQDFATKSSRLANGTKNEGAVISIFAPMSWLPYCFYLNVTNILHISQTVNSDCKWLLCFMKKGQKLRTLQQTCSQKKCVQDALWCTSTTISAQNTAKSDKARSKTNVKSKVYLTSKVRQTYWHSKMFQGKKLNALVCFVITVSLYVNGSAISSWKSFRWFTLEKNDRDLLLNKEILPDDASCSRAGRFDKRQ